MDKKSNLSPIPSSFIYFEVSGAPFGEYNLRAIKGLVFFFFSFFSSPPPPPFLFCASSRPSPTPPCGYGGSREENELGGYAFPFFFFSPPSSLL